MCLEYTTGHVAITVKTQTRMNVMTRLGKEGAQKITVESVAKTRQAESQNIVSTVEVALRRNPARKSATVADSMSLVCAGSGWTALKNAVLPRTYSKRTNKDKGYLRLLQLRVIFHNKLHVAISRVQHMHIISCSDSSSNVYSVYNDNAITIVL